MVGKINNMGKKIVFDLETKKTFDEVGGTQNAHLLGMSVCGVYDYEFDKYQVYKESDIKDLEKLFKQAELLIGFNSKHFDNSVLQPYFDLDLKTIPHLDILEEVVNKLGFRIKLESLAQSTLYSGKSGSGLDAIAYYHAGDWNKLIKYCLDDVKITKDLYEYGLKHGHLWYQAGGKVIPFTVSWGEQPNIKQILSKVISEHQRVEIEYLQVVADKVSREQRLLDIRSMDQEKIKAYDHNLKAEKIFTIARILSVKIVGQMSSFQPQLF